MEVGNASRRHIGKVRGGVSVAANWQTLGQTTFSRLQGVSCIAYQQHAALAGLQDIPCDFGVCPGRGTTMIVPSP